MVSIALSVIGCIDYLAYGTIFTRAMFLPKKNLMFFFPPEKPEMSPGGEWWMVCTVYFTVHTSFLLGMDQSEEPNFSPQRFLTRTVPTANNQTKTKRMMCWNENRPNKVLDRNFVVKRSRQNTHATF